MNRPLGNCWSGAVIQCHAATAKPGFMRRVECRLPDARPWWNRDFHADRRPFLEGRARIRDASRAWFRSQGFTRSVYTELQERVKLDPNLGGVRLYVDRGNAPAIAVYEKLGMTREHYHLYEWMK